MYKHIYTKITTIKLKRHIQKSYTKRNITLFLLNIYQVCPKYIEKLFSWTNKAYLWIEFLQNIQKLLFRKTYSLLFFLLNMYKMK